MSYAEISIPRKEFMPLLYPDRSMGQHGFHRFSSDNELVAGVNNFVNRASNRETQFRHGTDSDQATFVEVPY